MIKVCYHTQENRGGDKLTGPIKCVRDDAWFGDAYYYWESLDDANYWGKVSKKTTGRYDVYSSNIETENFLDTVFNEKHYRAWLNSIEKLALKFKMEMKMDLGLKELNDYFKERGLYKDIEGVVFQDISNNPNHYLVKGLQYKKRIQLAVFNKIAIKDFVFLQSEKSRGYDRYR